MQAAKARNYITFYNKEKKKKMNEMKLTQKPVINHQLQEVGVKVSERINSLNLNNLVATDENIKLLKNTRASLNKELKEFEEERKLIKSEVAKPYQEFESIYKSEISLKYNEALNILKDKIFEVEKRIKTEKEDSIKRYFNELCSAEDLEFLKFEDLNFDINLSTTEKSYRKRCLEFVERVVNDVQLVTSMEEPEQMIAEYKTCLDAGKAINNVRSRLAAIKQEKERAIIRENNRRVSCLNRIKMFLDQDTNCFVYNEFIYIKASVIKDLEKNEFDLKYIELEEQIKVYEKQSRLEENVETNSGQPDPVVLKPPTEQKKEELEIVTARFEIEGTYIQLKSVGDYLRKNNINYKNI
jgi:hypothetical protein